MWVSYDYILYCSVKVVKIVNIYVHTYTYVHVTLLPSILNFWNTSEVVYVAKYMGKGRLHFKVVKVSYNVKYMYTTSMPSTLNP